MRASCDVAVVGYGPVGQALAILLGQRGWRVVALEKQPVAYALPRAVHFDGEVGRILQAAGVAEPLAALTEPADAYEWRNAAGAKLLRFDSRAMGSSGWPEANMFAQPALERLLDQRARSLASVEVHRACEVVGLRPLDDAVELDVAGADGDRRSLQARYVVGCDGANSFVREHLGATVSDLGFFFDWLIVDIRPHQPRVWSPLNVQICDPARPTTLVSGGPGRRRWEFMRLPGERIEDLNREETAWRLLEPWGVNAAGATLERHAVYRFQARWVDTWRRGRLLLAGDAAHQMPPFAGQGLCAGLRDAANLNWKLDLVLAGRAADALLDTYHSERVPHVQAMIQFSMELGRVICVADAAEAAARDALMSAAAAAGQLPPAPAPPRLGAGAWRAGDPHAGRPFIQGRVRSGGESGRFDDVVGSGWVLLGHGIDPSRQLDADAAAILAALGARTANVGPDDGLQDLDGTYARWFADARVAIVLQRPDFYVFGTSAADGVSELIRQVRRALGRDG